MKAHVGIQGNVAADKLAKAGALMDPWVVMSILKFVFCFACIYSSYGLIGSSLFKALLDEACYSVPTYSYMISSL